MVNHIILDIILSIFMYLSPFNNFCSNKQFFIMYSSRKLVNNNYDNKDVFSPFFMQKHLTSYKISEIYI